MDDLSRSEYPAMLANLQPSQAVQALSDRVKRISRVNQEIADWLQERRKVEEQYVAGLRKLLVFKVPNSASELGVFQGPWDKILQSTDAIATSHQIFASRVEKDVEHSLRNFQNKKEMQNIQTISANLHTMSKELEDATEKSEKLSKKGGKANAQKVEHASARLESATQQWESQAPFIFETLQALDEQRINHVRDVLTQYGTHEVDQSSRTQKAAEEVLNTMLEVNTAQEIQSFAQRMTAGRPKLERKSTTRQPSIAGSANLAPPSITGHEDDASDHSMHKEGHSESKLRSRIGTMLGRRRQSVHGGFGQLAPPKGFGSFSRNLGSSHGQTLSPRASSHNLTDSQNRLSSLAESPTTERPNTGAPKTHNEGTNGIGGEHGSKDTPSGQNHSILNGTAEDIFDAPPPPGPPPSQQNKEESSKDAEGFTIPTATNDPISQAQREAAADEADQFFKLNISTEPIQEEDHDAKKAALSNVANTLTQMGIPSRKTGTIRGRRDVRNTIYIPSLPISETSSDNPFPTAPTVQPTTTPVIPRPTPSSTFASEASHGSDTHSIRSGTSFGGVSSYSVARLKHPDMNGPEYGPGLHSSIIETVSAVFQDGVVKSAKVNGEIALSYSPDPDSSQPDRETIRLNNFARLEAIGPNRLFVTNSAPTSPDEFTIDISHLSGLTTPAFTYRVHAEDEAALASHCPIAVHPIWKPQGDKLGLLLQYRLNPQFPSAQPVTLSNVVFIATYEGARASGVQTKPSGTHVKDKHLVYWRVGDVTLAGGESWNKIICRVIGEQNAEPKPGHVEVKWEYASTGGGGQVVGSGISVSRLVEGKGKEKVEDVVQEEEDPFADDRGSALGSPGFVKEDKRNWKDVEGVVRLVGGKYEGR